MSSYREFFLLFFLHSWEKEREGEKRGGERNKWKRQTTMISTEIEKKKEPTIVETMELSLWLCMVVCYCGLCSCWFVLFSFICFDSFVRLFFNFCNFFFLFSVRLKFNLCVSIHCMCARVLWLPNVDIFEESVLSSKFKTASHWWFSHLNGDPMVNVDERQSGYMHHWSDDAFSMVFSLFSLISNIHFQHKL